MTEEEAKGKFCFRASTFSGSQQIAEGPGPFCIGSACMAWRWVPVHDGSFNTTLSGPLLEVAERVPNFVPSDRGFCGLAGQP